MYNVHKDTGSELRLVQVGCGELDGGQARTAGQDMQRRSGKGTTRLEGWGKGLNWSGREIEERAQAAVAHTLRSAKARYGCGERVDKLVT